MKKIDLGQIFGILANLGVIAGIVFLAVELGQNNELMAAEARFNRLSIATESMTILAENPDLAEFLLRANASEALAPHEQARLDYYLVRTFFNMQWTYNEVPESLYPIERWRAVMNEPARQRSWEAHKAELSTAYVEFVDENVIEN